VAKGKLILVHGGDEFKVDASAREKVHQLCPPDQQATGLFIIDGAVDRVDEVVEVCGKIVQALFTVSLFGEATTVWLKNASFLNPYKDPGRSAGAKEQVAGIVEKLSGGTPGNHLVISSPRLDKRSAVLKFFDKQAEVTLHERPKKEYQIEKSASAQAATWFKEAGLVASPTVVKRFLQRSGNDTRQIRMEIDKLAVYAGDGAEVTAEMVELLVSPSREAIFWDFTDAFGTGRLEPAVRLLHQLLVQRESPVSLLIQLTNRVRDLIVIRECIDRSWLEGDRFVGGAGADAALEGVHPDPRSMNPYRLKNLAKQARTYSLRRLVRIRELFLSTHEKMIYGKVPHPLLLEMALVRAIGHGKP